MKFIDDAFGRSRRGTWVAPTQTGAVVADDAIGLCKRALRFGPTQHRGHESRLKHDGWTSLPFVQHMQTMGSQINKLARRKMLPGVGSQTKLLVDGAGEHGQQQQSKNPNE